MSKCPKCGAEMQGAFCPACGAAAPAPNPTINVVNAPRAELTEKDLPDKFKPLSPWAYFGYSLLLSLPIVGVILLFVYTFSSKNINRRNWVRSFWCAALISAIICIVFVIIGLATGMLAQWTEQLGQMMKK